MELERVMLLNESNIVERIKKCMCVCVCFSPHSLRAGGAPPYPTNRPRRARRPHRPRRARLPHRPGAAGRAATRGVRRGTPAGGPVRRRGRRPPVLLIFARRHTRPEILLATRSTSPWCPRASLEPPRPNHTRGPRSGRPLDAPPRPRGITVLMSLRR